MAKQAAEKQVVKKPREKAKKKIARHVPAGVVHVLASFNNTTVTITDPAGNVVAWSSPGKVGYSGSRKSSAYAASMATQDAVKAATAVGLKEVEVNLKGPGTGREAVVRALVGSGLTVTTIRDKTPVAHNGCRGRKRRRV